MDQDKFVPTQPDNQNAIDCFKGNWYTKFPEAYNLEAGECALCEDPRLEWACQVLPPDKSWEVLELGPLEGAHSYYFEKNTPVLNITAVEANRLCWLKCLVTKEITNLAKTKFLLGNFLEFLNHNDQEFDLCLAMGVLYHMRNPIKLIRLISQRCRHLILWTQLADRNNTEWERIEVEDGEFKAVGYLNDYGQGKSLGKFIGGVESYSVWLEKESLLECLEHFGFRKIIQGPSEQNQFGDAITLVASKE